VSNSESVTGHYFFQAQAGVSGRTVHGTVVNSVTGEPIYRALVQVGGQFAALTDHEGHFEFDGVEAGSVVPWAMKPGYFANNQNRVFDIAGSISPQSSDAPVILKLIPEAVISGTVTGQDGTPLEGIPVQLRMLGVQDGLSRWRQRQGTRTNSEGQYRFAELEAGTYAVTTGFHTEGLEDSQSAVAYVPTRYPPPGGSTSSGDSGIVLRAGDHGQADLTPAVERLYPVTASIDGPRQGRGASFRVETPSGDEITPMLRFYPRMNEYRLMLPTGSYTVTATAYSREGTMEARREVTVARGPVGGVSFAMEPYGTIPVDLEFQTVSQTQGNGQPNASPNYFGANISLTSANEMGTTQFLSAQPRRQDGSSPETPGPMRIENVAPGKYVLQAQPQSPWYVSAASCGSVDLTREELVIVGGAIGCSIRIVMRNDSGGVQATIRGGGENGGFQGERALAVYALPVGDLVRRVVTLNQNGASFSADGMAPGRYRVLALDHPQELPYRDAEAMRRYSGLGEEVTVTPNGRVDVEVSLETGGGR
jgi:hypothetical protein